MPTTDDLQNEINSLRSDLTDDEQLISDAYTALAEHQTHLDLIDGEIRAIQTELADHETRIAILEKKRLAFSASYKKLLKTLLSKGTLQVREFQDIYGPIAAPGELPDLPSPDTLTGQVVDETTRVVGSPQAAVKDTP